MTDILLGILLAAVMLGALVGFGEIREKIAGKAAEARQQREARHLTDGTSD